MGSKENQARRQKLWEADPHCHWCGVLTVPPVPNGKRQANTATLDHIHSRLDPLRAADGSYVNVLACHKCNGKRAHEEHMKLTAEENRLISWGGRELYRVVT